MVSCVQNDELMQVGKTISHLFCTTLSPSRVCELELNLLEGCVNSLGLYRILHCTYLICLAFSAFICLLPLLHHPVVGCVLGNYKPLPGLVEVWEPSPKGFLWNIFEKLPHSTRWNALTFATNLGYQPPMAPHYWIAF